MYLTIFPHNIRSMTSARDSRPITFDVSEMATIDNARLLHFDCHLLLLPQLVTRKEHNMSQLKAFIVKYYRTRRRVFAHDACYLCPVLTEIGIGRKISVKGKAVPLQTWSGPEGSRKLLFPDYMTTAEDGGTHRPHLPPGNAPGTHFC